ncbi:MAG TPA: EpsG family protein [Balneolaceae bacterium]|nr:EpsG family protein [Balneolaceae bacterium]
MNQDSKTGFYAVILFVVWPLLAVASAFKNYKHPWAKNILWAFIAFYGFSFAVSTGNSGADIVRYVQNYQNLHEKKMTLASSVKYFEKSNEVDVASTIIAIVLSRFSDSQAVLTMIYGLIFGFFFSRNMWFVLERFKGPMKPITILLFICFFLVIPIWNLNGFRFWTAAHVFIYGALPYLFDGKRKGIIIAASSILVHFAFIVPVLVLIGYMLLGNRLIIYFIFFLMTLFISQINLRVFNQVVENYAPKIIQKRTAGYRGKGYVKKYRERTPEKKKNWYVVWYNIALDWSVMGFLIILFLKGRSFFSGNQKWLSLFSFTLLYYGVANLLASLPSGGRYISIAQMLALALIMLYVQKREQERVMERFVWVATPALMLFIVVAIRTGLYSMSATSVLGNPIVALFLTGDYVSLNDFVKMIL